MLGIGGISPPNTEEPPVGAAPIEALPSGRSSDCISLSKITDWSIDRARDLALCYCIIAIWEAAATPAPLRAREQVQQLAKKLYVCAGYCAGTGFARAARTEEAHVG